MGKHPLAVFLLILTFPAARRAWAQTQYPMDRVVDSMLKGAQIGRITNDSRRLQAETEMIREQTEMLRQQNESLRRQQRAEFAGFTQQDLAQGARQLALRYSDFPRLFPIVLQAIERHEAGSLSAAAYLESWYFGIKYGGLDEHNREVNAQRDVYLVQEFPGLADEKSALFDLTARIYSEEVRYDPAAFVNHRILRLSAKIAELELRVAKLQGGNKPRLPPSSLAVAKDQ